MSVTVERQRKKSREVAPNPPFVPQQRAQRQREMRQCELPGSAMTRDKIPFYISRNLLQNFYASLVLFNRFFSSFSLSLSPFPCLPCFI
jgi:hypothetical protein